MESIFFIWFLAPAVVQIAVLVLLVRRQVYRRGMSPFFFTYTLYSVVVTLSRLIVSYWTLQYADFYWSSELIFNILAILSLNEVFSRIFRQDYQERPWLVAAFPSTVLVIICGLFIWLKFVYQAPHQAHLSVAAAAMAAFNLGAHSVEGVILVLFVILRFILAPGWNRYDYGILVGFGVSAVITMTSDAMFFQFGSGSNLWYRYGPGIGYFLATLIWLQAFWRAPDPQPQPAERFRTMLERTERSNQVIRLIHDWLKRKH